MRAPDRAPLAEGYFMKKQLALPQQPGHDGSQGQLWDELDVNTLWVHVLRGTPLDQMGVNGIAVYIMLKTYTDLADGTAFPGIDTLADRLQTSRDTVERALNRLIELGLITREKDPRNRRRNLYRFHEQLPLVRKSDNVPAGSASVRYVPVELQKLLEQLQVFARTGERPTGPQIVINLSLQIGDNNTQNVQNVTVSGGVGPGTMASHEAISQIKRLLGAKDVEGQQD